MTSNWLRVGLCLLLAVVGIFAKPSNTRKCGYAGCPATVPGKINVHLVPHTHDDVGWLKTPDQYYYGYKTNIQFAGVQYILDSVVAALLKNPERRFVYVESEFFFKWWDEQTSEMQEQVRTLVEEGRLEFIGGAWSMNDEAATHYQSIIDQFAYGLKRLTDAFGKCGRPRVGWQIDPFGHSREMASLFAQMGYDGEFFARLDWVERNDRFTNKTAEMIWHGSESLGPSTDLFTGILYNHYSSPPGFCFDVLCQDDPIIDGVSYDKNVDKRVNDFINYAQGLSQRYRTNNIIVPMGDDFQYQDALINFKNMDKLIKYVNALGSDVNVFYSSPSCYVKSVHDAKITWPAKNGDFFPYSSDQHSYWTGYFTSRPTVKRFERDGNHFLQVCKQLSTLAKLDGKSSEARLNHLRDVMGVMQHHDAITGTEKQAVAFDYEEILYDALIDCMTNTKKALKALTGFKKAEFQSCLYLNISSCEISENMQSFMITLYNPLSAPSGQAVRVPVHEGSYVVKNENGDVIPSQLVAIPDGVLNLPFRFSVARYELVFTTIVTRLDTLYVTRVGDAAPVQRSNAIVVQDITESPTMNTPPSEDDQDTIVENSNVQLTFGSDGYLNAIQIKSTTALLNVTANIKQEFLYYKGADGSNNRASGAYIFRPNGTTFPLSTSVFITVHDGPIVKEVHQVINEWVTQVIRIYEGKDFVEFEWLVGPIPVDDNVGKEIVSRFSSDLYSSGVFYTDSNGREMLKRVRNERPDFQPNLDEYFSSNYYPVTSKIALSDESRRLAILTDRAQGGSSLAEGALELMVHRRLLHDDGFGVGEALNEQAYGQGLVVRGKHQLFLSANIPYAQMQEKKQELESLLPFWKFFSTPDVVGIEVVPVLPDLSYIPTHIHLLTMEPWTKNQVLIRLENTLELGVILPTTFSLKPIVDGLGGIEIREATLDGNQWLSDMERLKFSLDGDLVATENSGPDHAPLFASRGSTSDQFTITLNPMQIKTFIINLKEV